MHRYTGSSSSATRGSTSGRPTSAFGGLRSVGSSQAMASASAISSSTSSSSGSGTAAANSGQHKSLTSTDSFYRDKVLVCIHVCYVHTGVLFGTTLRTSSAVAVGVHACRIPHCCSCILTAVLRCVCYLDTAQCSIHALYSTALQRVSHSYVCCVYSHS
jgi:hypothetical protein